MDAMLYDEVHRLGPMLFGRIRWAKGLGSPVGEPSSGFTVHAEERTASQFREGSGGIEVIPGTGVWRTIADALPCQHLPDEGDLHVVGFTVPDVHLNGFPDGAYRVTPTLSGKWSRPALQLRIGFRRVEPRSYAVSLTQGGHIRSVDFEVVYQPWLPRLR